VRKKRFINNNEMTGGKIGTVKSGRSYKLTLLFHPKKFREAICGKIGGKSNNFKNLFLSAQGEEK
jgi:hypothetical protein